MEPVRSSCAACKIKRRKCSPDCIFAPYLPQDQMHKFSAIHKVFGESNIRKLLSKLPVEHRKDAVHSLVYEAECLLRDPLHGCIPPIIALQEHLKTLKGQLEDANKELAKYRNDELRAQQMMGVGEGASAQTTPAMMRTSRGYKLSSAGEPSEMAPTMGIPVGGSSLEIREPGPHSHIYNASFHPEKYSVPPVTIRAQQQRDITGAFSSNEPEVVGLGLNLSGPQSNNNTFHPEQLVNPMDTVNKAQQQETSRVFRLMGKNIRFDMSRGFDIGAEMSSGAGVVGLSPQQEISRAFELQQHGKDIRFDGGQGFNVGSGSYTGIDPSPLHVSSKQKMGSFDSDHHLSLQLQQGLTVEERQSQQEELQQGPKLADGER